MSLIKLKDIGFGLNGKTLDITIAIPKDRYLVSFHVYTQNDIAGDSCSGIGTEYLDGSLDGSEKSFRAFFGEPIGQEIDPVTEQEYDIYKLLDSALVSPVSQQDMTIVSMQLTEEGTEDCSDSKLIVPLFNLTPLRLSAINAFKRNDTCTLNREFIDKVLQIKAIETAICCRQYCDAAKFWKQFWSKKGVKQYKKCGCHGGVA